MRSENIINEMFIQIEFEDKEMNFVLSHVHYFRCGIIVVQCKSFLLQTECLNKNCSDQISLKNQTQNKNVRKINIRKLKSIQ